MNNLKFGTYLTSFLAWNDEYYVSYLNITSKYSHKHLNWLFYSRNFTIFCFVFGKITFTIHFTITYILTHFSLDSCDLWLYWTIWANIINIFLYFYWFLSNLFSGFKIRLFGLYLQLTFLTDGTDNRHRMSAGAKTENHFWKWNF